MIRIIIFLIVINVGAYLFATVLQWKMEDIKHTKACAATGGEWVTLRYHEPRKLCIHV